MEEEERKTSRRRAVVGRQAKGGQRGRERGREIERTVERRWELKPCRRSARRSDEPSGRRSLRRGTGRGRHTREASTARDARGWRRGVRRKAARERDGLAVVGTRATKRALPTRARGWLAEACVRANEIVHEALCVMHANVWVSERACVRACESGGSVGRLSDTSTHAS